MNIVLAGVPALTLIVGGVQGFKALGLPTRFAAVAALVLAVAVATAGHLVEFYPASAGLVESAVAAFALWLMAIGVYEKGRDLLDVWRPGGGLLGWIGLKR